MAFLPSHFLGLSSNLSSNVPLLIILLKPIQFKFLSLSPFFTSFNTPFKNWIFCIYLCVKRRQGHPTPVLLPENPMDGGAW